MRADEFPTWPVYAFLAFGGLLFGLSALLKWQENRRTRWPNQTSEDE